MEFRTTDKSNAKCRVCYKTIEKHSELMFHHYSSANKGMNIIFCLECVDRITKLRESLKTVY